MAATVTHKEWRRALFSGLVRTHQAVLVLCLTLVPGVCLVAEPVPGAWPGSDADIVDFLTDGDIREGAVEDVSERLDDLVQRPVCLSVPEPLELNRLFWLSPFQISVLCDYIRVHGPPVSVYELAYLPGFSTALMRTLMPFVVLCDSAAMARPVGSRHRAISSYHRALQGGSRSNTKTPVLGSRDKISLRYQYQGQSGLTLGWLASKDPGEEFFSGSNRKGFDAYSGYLLCQGRGWLQKWVVGDFKADFGYGLVLGASGYSARSMMISRPARSSGGLRGYTGASGQGHFRGLGAVWQNGPWQGTLFVSATSRDASMEADSTGPGPPRLGVRTLITTGVHATPGDLEHRGALREYNTGINLTRSGEVLRLSLTGLGTRYGAPFLPGEKEYQRYEFSGSGCVQASLSYTLLCGRWWLFGAYALARGGACAWLQGVQVRLGGSAHATLLSRSFSPDYYAPYGNTFTQGTTLSNERGFLLGFEFPLGRRWWMKASADMFAFPRARSTVSSPSGGYEILLRAEFSSRQSDRLGIQWREERKVREFSGIPGEVVQSSLRLDLERELSPFFRYQLRLEGKLVKKPPGSSRGVYLGQDLRAGRSGMPLQGSLRLAFFDTRDYDARIYAYEQDLLYQFTVPAFFDRGVRVYIQVYWSMSRKASLRFKCSRTFWPGRGQSATEGLSDKNTRTEVRVQFVFKS